MNENVEYKGYTIRVELDECNESPREWDNAGKMICWHGRFNLGDEHDFTTPQDFIEFLEEECKGAIVLPLYLYDHSGISMSTSNNGYLFSCIFDSGQVGYIYFDRETILKEWGYKYITEKRRKFLVEYLQGEVNTYDQYLRGEIYWYAIDNPEGEELSSCGGFYGYDYMLDDAKSEVDYYHEHTPRQLEFAM